MIGEVLRCLTVQQERHDAQLIREVNLTEVRVQFSSVQFSFVRFVRAFIATSL